MVPEDVTLAGYRERVAKAVEEDPAFETYLYRKQAYFEVKKVLGEQEKWQLPSEDVRKIVLAFYKGVDLVYSDRGQS